MKVVRHNTATDLLRAAAAFFEETEARNHLVLAVAESVTRRGGDDAAFLVTVEYEGRIVGVALQTPPFPMLVTELSDVGPLCNALVTRPTALNGPPETVRAIADRLGGGTVRKQLRSHVLTAVTPATRTAGTMRLVHESDRAMLVEWFRDYLVDIDMPHAAPETLAERVIREQSCSLWVTERPVSMATISGRTPRGRRVGDVFTPRSERGRGYAEALVAALSQQILDEGARFCFLYTDVANPTSNAIYRRIGYTPNGDAHEIVLAG